MIGGARRSLGSEILIKQADPEVVEEWKWRGVPVWSHAGMICTGETYKNVVKMTFAKGASLEDPSGLFNSSLEGNTRRAIDFHEGDKIDEKALKALIRAAVALNTSVRATARPVRSQKIDARIKELSDWRGEMLARVRTLIKQADPEVVEEWKWRGVPVWSHAGMICTGETYKNVVKMTFARGASLEDPSALFNSSLEGNTRRAIDFHEGDKIDERALKALIRAAVALNTSVRAAAGPVRSQKKPKSA